MLPARTCKSRTADFPVYKGSCGRQGKCFFTTSPMIASWNGASMASYHFLKTCRARQRPCLDQQGQSWACADEKMNNYGESIPPAGHGRSEGLPGKGRKETPNGPTKSGSGDGGLISPTILQTRLEARAEGAGRENAFIICHQTKNSPRRR